MIKTHEELRNFILERGFKEIPQDNEPFKVYTLELELDCSIQIVIHNDESMECDISGFAPNTVSPEEGEKIVRPILNELSEFYYIPDPVEETNEPSFESTLENEVNQEEITQE